MEQEPNGKPTSVESGNKTLHFQAGNGSLSPMDTIELPPDHDLYINLATHLLLIYSWNAGVILNAIVKL
jgi:hypothetical protein